MATEPDIGAYCRAIEAHLCRQNHGHLVRVAGPAFDLVAGWARQGVPLKVALHGIDRTVARLTARGPRRRPVRIEFCEADVLEAFDAWRRSIGPALSQAGLDDESAATGDVHAPKGRRPPSLTSHLDRVLVRLASLLAGTALPPALAARIETALAELETLRETAARLRGEARVEALARLARMDEELVACAMASADPGLGAEVAREAAEELAGYRGRMPDAAFDAAVQAAARRVLVERIGLPRLAMPTP